METNNSESKDNGKKNNDSESEGNILMKNSDGEKTGQQLKVGIRAETGPDGKIR